MRSRTTGSRTTETTGIGIGTGTTPPIAATIPPRRSPARFVPPPHPDILPDEPAKGPAGAARLAVTRLAAWPEARPGARKIANAEPEPDFLEPAPGSNAYHARHGVIPCETNPETGKLARMREGFHARATATIGADGAERRHVCETCRKSWHRFNKSEPGLAWGKVRGKSAAAMVVELTTLTAEDLDDEDESTDGGDGGIE